jgi:hypothetical protein
MEIFVYFNLGHLYIAHFPKFANTLILKVIPINFHLFIRIPLINGLQFPPKSLRKSHFLNLFALRPLCEILFHQMNDLLVGRNRPVGFQTQRVDVFVEVLAMGAEVNRVVKVRDLFVVF